MEAIYEAAIACSCLFNALGGVLAKATEPPSDRKGLLELENSFNLWINSTGALDADIRSSLDARLQDHDDIREMVLELLQMLNENLQCLHDGYSAQLQPNSEAELEEDWEDVACSGVQFSIDELHFMAAAIRKSSVLGNQYNLSTQFERADDPYFQEHAFLLVRDTFPHARRSLCKHLEAWIGLRRRLLLRKMLHESKPSTRRPSDRPSVKPAQHGPQTAPSPQSSPSPIHGFRPSDHLDEDSEPYVCLSEQCVSPFLLFSDMKQWLEHMKSAHSEQWNRTIHMSTWVCDVGHETGLQFNDHESFLAHVKDPEAHPDRQPPTDIQLKALSRRMQTFPSREDEFCCPLCDCVPDIIRPLIPTSDPVAVRELLYGHIAGHLKDLAIFSFPELENEINNIRETSDAANEGQSVDDGILQHPSEMQG